MASLIDSPRLIFARLFARFSTYLCALFGFMDKLLFSLKEDSNPSMESISLEAEELKFAPLTGIDSIGSEKEDSKLESFLSFRFRSYEEFIDTVKNNESSSSDDDDDFYDPCFDAQITEDFDGTLGVSKAEKGDDHCKNSSGPYLPSKAASLQEAEKSDDHSKANSLREDGDKDLKAKKSDDHCKNSDGPFVCLKGESFRGDGGDDHCENSDDCVVPEDPKAGKGDDCRVPEHIKALVNEDDFDVSSGSDSESVVSSSNFSLRSSLLDSVNGAYLSDEDDDLKRIEFGKGGSDRKLSLEEEAEFQELSKGYENDDSEEDEELLEELKCIEEDLKDIEGGVAKEKEALDWEEEDDEDEEEETNGMETQWEHQDLIEQLRMEIGKVRAVGLPTIFEDAEPPKMADDLKPWKIDERLFRTGGTMDEVHKFYKSYRERMRKFDIFNFQKMYAIGFLRLKDPLQSFSPQKISLSTIVSQDCWPCKPKSSAAGSYPMLKFTRELESDLETVYVGQVCLSWEFLRWEYGKALALWDSDPHEVRRFNEVAAEFQQFQVLLQRFLEDEPFRGSARVQNFVKDRCVNRRLLQVPVIREDSAKDKMRQKQAGSTGSNAITSVILIEMIEESIRLVWRLVRSDKDTTTSTVLSIRKPSHPDLQNPEDAALLTEVRETLWKKQKKLKDLMRSECCILKKLQRNHTKQNYAGRVLGFFSQVDMKLVSRVLNMARVTTDQLAWCSSKLENIEFVDNRIRREPSFLLFPCS